MPARSLPSFIAPMLAKPGEPFDSDDYLFEIKWDGFRALCYKEAGRYRIVGRRKTDYTARYPELAGFLALPDGCIIDGEIVSMVEGRPDFAALLARQRSKARGRTRHPVTFVAFDLLYLDFESIQKFPCEQRRECLQQLVESVNSPRLVMSRSLVGDGKAYYEQVKAMKLEGIVAKRRNSVYEPGKRSGAWVKIKGTHELLCAIIGYEPSEERGMRSLIIAAPVEGELQWVGQVGSGITAKMHDKLLSLLEARRCKQPIVPCTIKGRWVVPDLYCTVSYLEWTKTGKLRGPVFGSLHVIKSSHDA
jgi:DNA ligase D-like protein (predicted ligase)